MGLADSQHIAAFNRSIAAVHGLLQRPRAARRVVIGLLAFHTALLAYSAYVHSPTLNEPAHLVAGLSHWKFGRFELYRNNPPLVKMVAALPVMAAGFEEDWSGYYEGAGAAPQDAMGRDFVAANGERSSLLFMIARWGCIPFSWIGGSVCYLWGRDLFGRPSGVAACAIWCFEPNILAHASLLTPDAHAASLGLAACYTFWRWLKRPTWSQAVLNGAVLGLAELSKTTLLIFYPLWPLMWLIYRWPEWRSLAPRDWAREVGMLVLRMAIGLYVLNFGYAFEGTLKPLGQFHFISALLAGRSESDHLVEARESVESPEPTNRFAKTWLASVPVPLPANYVLGIDILQEMFEKYDRPSFLRGDWRTHGWWHYYLYATAIKVPLGLLALSAISLFSIMLLRSVACKSQPIVPIRDIFILLFPALVIFIAVSANTGFSEHFRYVLPCFPFAFVLISGSFRNFLDISEVPNVDCASLPRRQMIRSVIAPTSLTLLLWFGASNAWIYPHSLSYFNELIGGPRYGHRHLLGSNLDWGQDLFYLKSWWKQQSGGSPESKLFLAHVSVLNARDLGVQPLSRWPSISLRQDSENSPWFPSGEVGKLEHFAISRNLICGDRHFFRDGYARRGEMSSAYLSYLKCNSEAWDFTYSLVLLRARHR